MFGLLVVLFVKAKKESGFWRAKRFWPFDGVEVDTADLSKEELAAIKAEPMLIVKEKGKTEGKGKQDTPPPAAPPAPNSPENGGANAPAVSAGTQEPGTPPGGGDKEPTGPAPEPGTGEELTGEQMEEMTVDELRALAKVLGLSGYSEAKKADLIKMVSQALQTDAANAQE
jgi:hypothetical protein